MWHGCSIFQKLLTYWDLPHNHRYGLQKTVWKTMTIKEICELETAIYWCTDNKQKKMILLLVKGLFNSPWMIVLHNSEEWNSSHSCVIVFARSTVHVMWHVVPFLLFLWQSSALEWSAAVCRVLDYLTRCNYSVSLPVFVWYGHCNPMQL